jgi:hypothetical protein
MTLRRFLATDNKRRERLAAGLGRCDRHFFTTLA